MTTPDEPWTNGQLDAGQQVGRGIIRHEVGTEVSVCSPWAGCWLVKDYWCKRCPQSLTGIFTYYSSGFTYLLIKAGFLTLFCSWPRLQIWLQQRHGPGCLRLAVSCIRPYHGSIRHICTSAFWKPNSKWAIQALKEREFHILGLSTKNARKRNPYRCIFLGGIFFQGGSFYTVGATV